MFMIALVVIMALTYLLLPPPPLRPPPPPKLLELPMLEEPRWLLARAPLPPPEEPENALRLLPLGELET